MISKRTIDAIFDATHVEDIVGEFVTLKKAGVNYKGLCPFHDEKTPSFTVSPSRNIYKCFGCGKGGNAVNFLMEHEGYSYPEALRHLAGYYKIEIEETGITENYEEQKNERDSLYLINEYARDFYKKQLHETDLGKSIGLSYFKERGLLLKTLERFELGFAPGSGDGLTHTAVTAGYNIELLRKLGLTTEKDRDFFFNRVMFPIHNHAGKVVAFAGRQLTNQKRSPKYINSRESEIYHKSKVLYAMHLAKLAIRKEDCCILVEGYTDVISLHQAGIENVVASSGTALTPDQIKLIKRYSKQVKVLYDGDMAGIKAAMRGINLILEQDMNVELVILPDGEDPDSYMKKVGVSDFRAFLDEQAKDFMLFRTELVLKEAANDPVRKSALIHDIIESLACIPDPIKRSVYIRQCADQLKVDEALLVNETNKEISNKSRDKRIDALRQAKHDHYQEKEYIDKAYQAPPQADETPGAGRSETQERDIIRILILFGHKLIEEDPEPVTVATYILSNIQEIIRDFDNDLYAKIVVEYAQRIQNQQSTDTKHFLNHTDKAISNLAIDLCASPYEYSDNWQKMWDIRLQSQPMPEENVVQDSIQALLRFSLKKYEKLSRQNMDLIRKKQEEGDEEGLIIHLQAQQNINQKRNEIAEKLNTVIL